MKIAIDVSPLSDKNNIRGVGFYLKHLKNALEKYFPDNSYSYFERSENIPNSVDVVHFPYFEPFFLTLSFFNKKKTIVTVHDLTPLVLSSLFPVGIKGMLKWHVQRLALKNVAAIITDSESSKKDISRLVGIPKSKIHNVYLAAGEHFRTIEDKKILKKVKDIYHLPDKFAFYVGDITPNKNVPRIIHAALIAKIPLVLVGKSLTDTSLVDNPWLSDLKNVRNLAMENPKQIRLLGFVPDEELVALYNLSSVFVMPSLYEGFGLPILEAMSCGCPVVTSDRGSLPEVAGNAALVVDAEDEESIAEGIKKIVEDTKFAKTLREKGLAQAKKFSWKKTAEETMKVYEKVKSL